MLNDGIIRITFIISLFVHCLFLCIPKFNFDLYKNTKKLDEIIVNIEVEKQQVLPRIEKIGNEKKVTESRKESDPSDYKIIPESQPEEIVFENLNHASVQETIKVINPDQEAMLRYQDIIKQKIEEKKEYPASAISRGIGGVVYLRFTVISDGHVDKIEIVKTSGYKVLDQSAVETVKKSSPFPPFPEGIKTSHIQMELRLVYELH